MIPQSSSISKELSCHVCGKLTSIYQLKAHTNGNWICSECSDRIFGRIKKTIPKEEKISFRKVDPFATEEMLVNPASQPKQVNPFEKKQDNIIKTPEKSLYKCLYCKFESRQIKEDVVCPNCGRQGRLVKVPQASEIVDNNNKEPFYD